MGLIAWTSQDDLLDIETKGYWADQWECFINVPETSYEADFFFGAIYNQAPRPLYLCFSMEFEPCLDFDVTSNLTWNTSNVPNGGKFKTLTVKSGYTLTIEDDLEINFCGGGILIVEPNAELHLYGTLTSDSGCLSGGWQGVMVQGNPNYNQYYDIGIDGYRQGRMFMYANAVVSNATEAVRLYGPTTSDTGGQLYAEGAIFHNNTMGVKFYSYQNFVLSGQNKIPRPYSSLIRDCKFAVDDDYIRAQPFSYHILMRGIDRLFILGCEFTNTMTHTNPVTHFKYGMGIYAFNSGFRVASGSSRSNFTGFSTAIGSYELLGGDRPFVVDEAVFQHNYFGIATRSVSGATITNNTFVYNTVPHAGVKNDQVGVHLSGHSVMINVQRNEFIRSGGTIDEAIGIVAENIGPANQVIRKNTFYGVDTGNEAFGYCADNTGITPTGLHYLCNENAEVDDADFYVPESSIYDQNRIRIDQGEFRQVGPNIEILSAGNTFSKTAYDWLNAGNEGVRYYYNNAEDDEEPETYFGISELIPETPNPCLGAIRPVPILDPGDVAAEKAAFFSHSALYTAAVGQNDTLEAQYYKMRLDSNMANILEYIQYDTLSVGVRDSLRLWLPRAMTLAADLWLAGDYIATAEYSAADDVLDSILVRYSLTAEQEDDIDSVRTIFTILSSKTAFSLDSAAIAQLTAIADNIGVSAACARSLLSLYDIHYSPVYYVPGDVNPRSDYRKEQNKPDVEKPVVVFPNPATDHITVVMDNELRPNTMITLYDLMGRIVAQKEIVHGANTISISALSPGRVFYRIHDDLQMLSHGSFVKL